MYIIYFINYFSLTCKQKNCVKKIKIFLHKIKYWVTNHANHMVMIRLF